jgi:hypothetical protein
MIPIRSDKALQTTIASRGVMDKSAKSTKLGRRMNSMSLAVVGILMEKDNSRSAVCRNEAGNSGKGQVLDKALPNSSDIGLVKGRLRKSPDITSGHSSIGASIDKRTEDGRRVMVREMIGDRGRIDAAIETTIHRNKIIGGTVRSGSDSCRRSLGTR